MKPIAPVFILALFASPLFADWIDGQMPVKRPDAVRPAVESFPLESVRLQSSDFLKVQEIEKSYLLSISPDRFLVKFRSEAGLPAKPGVKVYGGWEGNTPLAGHTFGHYISAAAMMYASTGDARLKAKVDESVAGLAEVQAVYNADPRWAGYLAAIPEGKALFEATSAGDVDLMGRKWIVPFYTQHKIMAGLLDAYRYCGNATALELAQRHADWMIRFFNPLSEELFQRMLNTEFGGIETPLAELYSITGEKKYLDFALRFEQKSIVDSWKEGRDNLPGIHANTQIPKADACAKVYEITGDKSEKRAAEFFWNTVVFHHTYVTGGNSDREYFGPADHLDNRFSAPTETCNTYNMLKLTEHLFRWNPSNPAYFDFYERALYNHILGAFNHKATLENGFQGGLTCYFIHFKPGECRYFDEPYDSFSCCFGTGMENPSKYGGTIFWRDLNNTNLYVNLFIPSQLKWKEQGVTAEIKTDYPASGKVDIVFSAQKDAQFNCNVRVPFWTGKTGYNTFNVELKAGESKTVSVNFPMTLRTESMPDNNRKIALFYGPTLLTADLGPANQRPVVPALVSQSDNPADWIEPIPGQALRFASRPGAFTRDDLTFLPFFLQNERRNCIYFDKYTAQQWEQYKADIAKRQREEQELAARTVDLIMPGEMQYERDHNVASNNSEPGEHNGRKFRHAVDGGWFSYEIKVNPQGQNELVCDYWGSDSGSREFFVAVNGVVVDHVKLNHDKPDEFFSRKSVIPQSVTEGKEKATVTFTAAPGNFAGGVFGIRVLK